MAVIPTLTEALAAAAIPGQPLSLQHSLASLANLRSAFTPMIPQQAPALYPEIALFSHFTQLFPGTTEIAQQQQRHWNAETSNRGGRSKSGDTKSSSAFASRHQAAEQRRRTRINDRCADIFKFHLFLWRVSRTSFEQKARVQTGPFEAGSASCRASQYCQLPGGVHHLHPESAEAKRRARAPGRRHTTEHLTSRFGSAARAPQSTYICSDQLLRRSTAANSISSAWASNLSGAT